MLFLRKKGNIKNKNSKLLEPSRGVYQVDMPHERRPAAVSFQSEVVKHPLALLSLCRAVCILLILLCNRLPAAKASDGNDHLLSSGSYLLFLGMSVRGWPHPHGLTAFLRPISTRMMPLNVHHVIDGSQYSLTSTNAPNTIVDAPWHRPHTLCIRSTSLFDMTITAPSFKNLAIGLSVRLLPLGPRLAVAVRLPRFLPADVCDQHVPVILQKRILQLLLEAHQPLRDGYPRGLGLPHESAAVHGHPDVSLFRSLFGDQDRLPEPHPRELRLDYVQWDSVHRHLAGPRHQCRPGDRALSRSGIVDGFHVHLPPRWMQSCPMVIYCSFGSLSAWQSANLSIFFSLNCSGMPFQHITRLNAELPFSFLYGSMPRTVLLTSRSDCFGKNGPLYGYPLSLRCRYRAMMSFARPLITARSQLTMSTCWPSSAAFAAWLAILPNNRSVASMIIR